MPLNGAPLLVLYMETPILSSNSIESLLSSTNRDIFLCMPMIYKRGSFNARSQQKCVVIDLLAKVNE